MKIMHCPINGPRPVSEFQYGGELRSIPDPAVCTDAQWADYVFNRVGSPGVNREWWFHIPSNTWFIAERDTAADRVLRTWLYGEGPE
ncbi:MAG: sarcosine oxidase subunit delta [Burkholderiales bacterium]